MQDYIKLGFTPLAEEIFVNVCDCVWLLHTNESSNEKGEKEINRRT